MSKAVFTAFAEHDLMSAGALLDCRIGDECDLSVRLARIRLEQLQEDAALEPWLLRAIVRRSDRQMIGHIGFHTAPGPDYLAEYAPDGVEIGYTVYEPYRRNGYAYEAVTALLEWAHVEQGVQDIVASVAPDNAGSLALLNKLSSRWSVACVGQYDDPIDGHEDVYLLRHR